jgi:Flp pilus assembly protein TadD
LKDIIAVRNVFLIGLLALLLAFCASASKKPAADSEKNPQYQYEKAVVALRYNLPNQAIEYLNQALVLNPNFAPALNLLGFAHFQQKSFGDAAVAYQRFLELQPNDSKARVSLGVVYEELGKVDQAEEEYKKADGIDGNPDASFSLAKLYYGQKKLEPALEYVTKSLAKNSRSVASLNLQGVILNQLGKYAEALASFENAVRVAPNDINLNVNLGIAYINNKEFARARQLFEKILPKVEDPVLKVKINEYLKLIKDNS